MGEQDELLDARLAELTAALNAERPPGLGTEIVLVLPRSRS
jgi:hypothetical protein